MKSTWFLILLGLCPKDLLPSIGFNLAIHIHSGFSLVFPLRWSQKSGQRTLSTGFASASSFKKTQKWQNIQTIFKPIQPPFSFCHALSTVSGISFYALEALQRDLKSTWWNIASETCQRQLLKWTWKALVFKLGLEVLAAQAMETQGFGICRNSPHSLLPNVLLFSSTYWTSYLDSAKRSCSILDWIFQKQPWFSSKAVDVHSTSPCHLAHLLNSRVPPWLNI